MREVAEGEIHSTESVGSRRLCVWFPEPSESLQQSKDLVRLILRGVLSCIVRNDAVREEPEKAH